MKYLIITMLLLCSLRTTAQNKSLNCQLDSAKYKQIALILQSKRSEENYYKLHKLVEITYTNVRGYNPNTDYCKLAIFIGLFDYFFDNLIEMKEISKVHTQSMCGSIAVVGMPELVEECEKENLENVKYLMFNRIYGNYKYHLFDEITEKQKIVLENDIDNIINSSLCLNPILVKNLLLGKYDNLIMNHGR